jgi:hypothetical protein
MMIEGFQEWAVSGIETHHGKGSTALFEVTWKAGDKAWLPYEEISHLEALSQYLEAQGVNSIEKLQRRISAEIGLPVAYMHPRDCDTLRTVVADVVEHAWDYSHGSMVTAIPDKKVHKKSAVGTEGVRTPQSCITMSSGSNKCSEIELETFSKFDAFVRHDGYNPKRHVILTGYVEFAV